jgi:hypothetical protein
MPPGNPWLPGEMKDRTSEYYDKNQRNRAGKFRHIHPGPQVSFRQGRGRTEKFNAKLLRSSLTITNEAELLKKLGQNKILKETLPRQNIKRKP